MVIPLQSAVPQTGESRACANSHDVDSDTPAYLLRLIRAYGIWVYLQVFQLFTKGNNFCEFIFASLENTASLNRDLILIETVCF